MSEQARWELERGTVETYGAVRSIHAFGPDAERLVKAAQDLAIIDELILEWWSEHEYDECGDPENPYNAYDDPPPFVATALRRAQESKP